MGNLAWHSDGFVYCRKLGALESFGDRCDGLQHCGFLYGAEEVNHDKPYPGDHGIQYEPAQSEHHIPGGEVNCHDGEHL